MASLSANNTASRCPYRINIYIAQPTPEVEENSEITTLELVAILSPFAVAFLLLLISPLITRKVQNFVVAQISRDTQTYLARYSADERQAIEKQIPPPLKDPDLGDHLGYMADAVQVFPYGLLPVVGGLFAITSNISTVIAAVILVVSIVGMIALDAWVLSRSASNYSARSLFGYTPVVLIGVIGNTAAIAAIIFWGRP
jgi:hypothetical protein